MQSFSDIFSSLHFLDYILVLLAYLIGSIPFGLVLTHYAGLGDIRRIGSGNIGATNVLRTGRKDLALATLILDGVKGVFAIALARYLHFADLASVNVIPLVTLFAILGHMFPVFLRFKGGKGVATTLACFLALNWPLGMFALLTWIAVFFLTRISSLSALVAVLLLAIATYILHDKVLLSYVTITVAVLIFIRHSSNIKRLLHGAEPRMSLRKNEATTKGKE